MHLFTLVSASTEAADSFSLQLHRSVSSTLIYNIYINTYLHLQLHYITLIYTDWGIAADSFSF